MTTFLTNKRKQIRVLEEIILDDGLRIGLIGLDTSHVEGFGKFLHDTDHPFYIPDGKITVAFPGGSPDFELSYSRVDKYTKLLKETYGVKMVDSLEEVANSSDAIMITSVDGRVHLEQFMAIVEYRKPIFIDKPFTLDTESAKQIMEKAKEHGTPIMSCSPLRYDESLSIALEDDTKGEIIGADCYGPMELQDTQPGLFWYGIHSVEMLYTILGEGCKKVTSYTNDDHDFVVGEWENGRIGTVRGNREGNREFGSTIHRKEGTQFSNSGLSKVSFHARQNKKIIDFMKSRKPDFDSKITIEITRFIEAANESRKSGKTVHLY